MRDPKGKNEQNHAKEAFGNAFGITRAKLLETQLIATLGRASVLAQALKQEFSDQLSTTEYDREKHVGASARINLALGSTRRKVKEIIPGK